MCARVHAYSIYIVICMLNDVSIILEPEFNFESARNIILVGRIRIDLDLKCTVGAQLSQVTG